MRRWLREGGEVIEANRRKERGSERRHCEGELQQEQQRQERRGEEAGAVRHGLWSASRSFMTSVHMFDHFLEALTKCTALLSYTCIVSGRCTSRGTTDGDRRTRAHMWGQVVANCATSESRSWERKLRSDSLSESPSGHKQSSRELILSVSHWKYTLIRAPGGGAREQTDTARFAVCDMLLTHSPHVFACGASLSLQPAPLSLVPHPLLSRQPRRGVSVCV